MIEKILKRLLAQSEEYLDVLKKEYDVWIDGKNEGLIKAIEIVQEVAKDGGWIPCSERLPQQDEPETALCEIVNITLKNGAVTVGWCNRYLEKWYVVDEHCDYPIPYKYEEVIAWQPLPAPYQKGE